MPTLPIAKLGNPVLRQIATTVDPRNIRTYDMQQFIDNLIETMLAEPGIGLAAPQVSRSIQLVVMGCEGEDGFPQTVLINPKIVFYGPEQVENWEGCLSVDGLRGKVTRPSVVRVAGPGSSWQIDGFRSDRSLCRLYPARDGSSDRQSIFGSDDRYVDAHSTPRI